MPAHVFLPDGRRVELTVHAVERYIERWKPSLERDAISERFKLVGEDLQRVIDCGSIVATHPPEWAHGEIDEDSLYVHCGDLYMVVQRDRQNAARWVGVTVIIRGDYPEEMREAITRFKRAVRAARRARARKGSNRKTAHLRHERREAKQRVR